MGTRVWDTLRILLKIALWTLPATFVGVAIKASAVVSGPLTLAVAVGLWCGVSWATIYAAVFSAEERNQISRIALMIVGR